MEDLIVRYNKMLEKIDSVFDVIALYHLSGDDPIKLSDDNDPKKCRFCHRTESEVTFHKTAHAISHMVENRQLKADYECDECNELFACYESDFSQYMNLYHTMFMVHGKGGIPNFKNGSSQFGKIESFDEADRKIKIQVKEDEESLIIWNDEDKAKNKIKVVGKRSYTPQNVLKALVKMAVSIAPENELANMTNVISWLRQERCEGYILPSILRIYRSSLPFTSCFLLKRKSSFDGVMPLYTFVLAYRNIVFQVPIPFVVSDLDYKGQKFEYPYFPTPLDLVEKPLLTETLLLNGKEKVKGERIELGLSYSEAIQEK